MDDPLVGGHLQRLALWRRGSHEVALFKVRVYLRRPGAGGGENVHVAVAAGAGVGVVDAGGRARLRDAMGGVVSPVQAMWRARLEGGRIAAVGERWVAVMHEGRRWHVGAEAGGALTLTERSNAPDDATADLDPFPARSEPVAASPGDGTRRDDRGARIVAQLARAETDGRRMGLVRAVAKAVARLERRIDAMRGDLTRARGVETAAEHARLFIAPAAKASRGATRLEAVDWSTGEARPIALAIDPARGAREQIDALFRRARRLRQGSAITRARLDDAERSHDALRAVAEACAAADDADLDALEARARAAAPRDFRVLVAHGSRSSLPSPSADSGRATAPGRGPHPPHRTFFGASGARILVGRAAAHNDALTFRVARPHDLWLHAKGRAGAHVVVPLDKGSSCPPDVLVEAAHLAVHFSDARDETLTEVEYAQRRYVRKPRGSAPGLVVVDREKVIVLRREPEVLRALLEREAPR
jgi:NFACT protein RNA binding domain/NFACT N-terminal and middle domains